MGKKNKFRWTQHLIECEQKYDAYWGNILTNNNVEAFFNALMIEADKMQPENATGYAASLVSDLCSEGEYVAKNEELANKYLEIGCASGETECLVEKILSVCETGEEADQKLNDLIENGCNKEFFVWYFRAMIRGRKSKYKSKTFKSNYFLKMGYMYKALTTVPKHKHFDIYRKKYKKIFLKMIIPPIILIILAIIIAIAA